MAIKIMYRLLTLYLLPIFLFAMEPMESSMLTKSFLIAKSTKSYDEAKRFAEKLSLSSGIKMDFRDLIKVDSIGLSEHKTACENQGYDFPCYVARGRYDDGVYISIEYSSAYNGFSKGYYIVMVASGEVPKDMLENIKRFVPDVYSKKSDIYMGCMH